MADDPIQTDETAYAVPATTAIPVTTARTVPELSDAELTELRRRLEREPEHDGGNRFGWFVTGFAAALVCIAVAALVFLAVSDRDDDGNINLDVPSIQVDG